MENTTAGPEISKDLSLLFGWPEYLVFIIMLGISAGIGVMYGCFGKKQNTTSEFLMAGRNMGTFPVTMSLIAR
jgi:sodium-coupled monocarboxylate transporter 8/12